MKGTTRLWRACGCLVGALMLACAATGIFLFSPIWVDSLPPLEIVFQVGPNEPRGSTEIGFTDSDGTRIEYLQTRSGSLLPAWSPLGDAIAYRWGPARGYNSYDQGQVWIKKPVGRYFLVTKDCTRRTWGTGRIRWTTDGRSLLTIVFAEDGKRDFIALIDPSRCKVSRVLVESAAGEDLLDPDLSVSGELAFVTRRKVEDHGETIVVIDPHTSDRRAIAQGISPAWSPDGQWLAYTALDGIYLIQRDGTGRRRLLDWSAYWPQPWAWYRHGYYGPEGWPARPEWSPDGKWIVYHRLIGQAGTEQRFAIFKLNVETGEEMKIVDSGINPHWRWNVVATPLE